MLQHYVKLTIFFKKKDLLVFDENKLQVKRNLMSVVQMLNILSSFHPFRCFRFCRKKKKNSETFETDWKRRPSRNSLRQSNKTVILVLERFSRLKKDRFTLLRQSK
jgi:hypothetical protein